VFGFPVDNQSAQEFHYRTHRLCPYNNRVPSCTKARIKDPIGVCSIHTPTGTAITCPVRFRQDWMITAHAAAFCFPAGATWTALSEITLRDATGKSAGNIDIVLVAYDATGTVTDFGSLEVQAVYISGNVRNPFKAYMSDPQANAAMDWSQQEGYPRPDYLSSSRKRLAPQLIFKGGILHAWRKKMAVAVDRGFFAQLPSLQPVSANEAEVAWLVYDLVDDPTTQRYHLTLMETVYTQFTPALQTITTPQPGKLEDFLHRLQTRLDKTLGATPDTAPSSGHTLDTLDLDTDVPDEPDESEDEQ
jgi:hypothetical protein